MSRVKQLGVEGFILAHHGLFNHALACFKLFLQSFDRVFIFVFFDQIATLLLFKFSFVFFLLCDLLVLLFAEEVAFNSVCRLFLLLTQTLDVFFGDLHLFLIVFLNIFKVAFERLESCLNLRDLCQSFVAF